MYKLLVIGAVFIGSLAPVATSVLGADDATGTSTGTLHQPSDEYTLILGEQQFDPLAGVPAVPAGLDTVSQAGPDLHLIQFMGPIQPDWIDGLRAAGVEIVQYIHPYTYIVWGDTSWVDSTRSGMAVRWAGPFVPAYRLLPRWRAFDATVRPVRVLLVRAANTDETVRNIEALGARLDSRQTLNDRFEIAGFDLAGTQFAAVANIPGVYSVQPVPTDGGLRGEMSDQVCADNVNGNNQAFPGYPAWLASIGVSGAGVIIANVDSGVQNNHPDLINRLIACTGQTCGGGATSAHGTHTAGLMAADGSSGVRDGYGFLRGLGVAPGAHLVEQVYSPWYTYPGGMLLLMTDSYNNGASLSGNSWGPAGSPRGYDNDTLQVDIGVRDADPNAPGNQPLSYVLSIMNGYGGTSTQGTPDEAKNIFTIGSTKMQNGGGQQILQIDDLSSNTAHGPCLDGRKIPHLVAPGCSVDSTVSTSTWGLMCGTSMASPHVSGAVALFIQYYRSLPGYAQDPSAALIKAAFLPAAHDLAGHLDANGNILGHPFDSKQGWGRMDVAAVVAPQVQVRYFDNPVVFTGTGQEWVQTVSAADPAKPLKVMLVWTDAPGHGLGGATPAWNNDLDLTVEDGTSTYRGNNFGASGWSVPGGVADYRNNTEGVFIGPTAAGTYTIRVHASNINSDGVPNFGGALDQDFALVCYNCAVEPGFTLLVTPTSADLCAPGDVPFSVEVGQVAGFTNPVTLSVSGVPAGATASFNPNPVTPPGTSTLTMTASAGVAPGEYPLHITGQSGLLIRTADVTLRLYTGVPAAVTLTAPANGATGVPLRPTFTWAAAAQAATYDIQVATDAGFNDVVVSATGLTDTSFTPAGNLTRSTQYFWHVRGGNVCGPGPYSATFSFTTRGYPNILLVDDDSNAPDVRAYYTDALTALARDYDVWDTNNSDNEPTAAELAPYSIVIWFTGSAFNGVTGPGTAGAAALGSFLDDGKSLFLSSQDYFYAKGLTSFMTSYLGVASVNGDVGQTTVTGAGTVFSGYGPYTLSYPFASFADAINPDGTAETAFVGNGSAAVDKDSGTYQTVFFGFPCEALPSAADRAAVLGAMLNWFRPFVDCNHNNVNDFLDILRGTSPDANHNGIPDECEPRPGDLNCDGVVDFADIDPFVLALSDQAAYQAQYPHCRWLNADCNNDGLVNFADIDPFVALLSGG